MSENKSVYEMTDDEIRNLDLSTYDFSFDVIESDGDQPDDSTTSDPLLTTPEAQNTEEVIEEQGDDSTAEAETTSETHDTVEAEESSADTDTVDSSEEVTNDQPSEAVDYQAFYNQLTKPFKANGREIQVKDANDMIALMQQGANYSKKMAQLKPHLNLVKTLETHGLTNPEKLAYLVDLYNKKPEAIAKLLKDADIDLYSFDTEQADNYTPQAVVNEPTPLQEMIESLYEQHQNFGQVIQDVSTLWDDQSKSIVAENPAILQAMAQQADTGLYQQIIHALDYERMLGRMVHVPFLQAYSEIEARILNAQANQAPKAQESFTAPRPTQQTQVTNQDKKRKAITPKTGSNNTLNADFDPLKLSDEEFIKYYNQMKFH